MKVFDIKPNSMSESCKNACEPSSNMIIMGYFYRTKFVLCFAVAAVSPLLVCLRLFCIIFWASLEPTVGGLVGFLYTLVDIVFGVVMLRYELRYSLCFGMLFCDL